MSDSPIHDDDDPRRGEIVAGPWPTAWLMMEDDGDGALAGAAGRAAERLDAGDLGGAESWLEIVHCIEAFLATRPSPAKRCTSYLGSADLPDRIRFGLSRHAQDIYREQSITRGTATAETNRFAAKKSLIVWRGAPPRRGIERSVTPGLRGRLCSRHSMPAELRNDLL